jgi:hypothetical protein
MEKEVTLYSRRSVNVTTGKKEWICEFFSDVEINAEKINITWEEPEPEITITPSKLREICKGRGIDLTTEKIIKELFGEKK